MAKSDIVGTGGAVTTPTGFNIDAQSWSVTVNVDTTVYSTFASRWKKSKLTNANVTGSVSGILQYNDANAKPVPLATATETAGTAITSFSGSATLTATTGCTISGTFNFTRGTFGRNDKQEMTATYDIESDGEVLMAWDESSS